MPFVLVFLASILGSVHCAAMCGGFVALCSQHPAPVRSQAAYHVGRLTTYILLGLIAGYVGSSLNRVGEKFGLTNIATLTTGILLVLTGICGLLRLNPPIGKAAIFHGLQSMRQRIIPNRTRAVLFPFSIGFCSTFLPCGWLYSYVAVAASQASIGESVAIMLVFWLGTVPILTLVGGLSNVIVSPLSKYAPLIASVLLILAGCLSIRNHLVGTVMCHDISHEHHTLSSSEQSLRE